jgi:sugar phosphate isomerase/epimerase
MYPAIFSNVIQGRDPEEIAARTAEFGLTAVQFIPREVQVGFGFDTGSPALSDDWSRWRRAFDAAGVQVVAVGGYLNLLHRDLDRRAAAVDAFTSYLRRMNELGTTRISTETGSLSPTGDWDDDPANRTPEAWDAFREVVTGLARTAESEGVTILLEPYIVNVCHTPALGVQMLQEIGSSALGICMDPTNFFTNELAAPEFVADTIKSGFAVEGPYVGLAHAKDVTPPAPGSPKPGLPGPGQGLIDYPLYLDLLGGISYDGPLVIEHLVEAEVPDALRFVAGHIAAHSERTGS